MTSEPTPIKPCCAAFARVSSTRSGSYSARIASDCAGWYSFGWTGDCKGASTLPT